MLVLARVKAVKQASVRHAVLPTVSLSAGVFEFVLRVHVIVNVAPFCVYMHEDVIVIKHAVAYELGSRDAAAHISSKGSSHPKPVLLASLPALHAQVLPQIQQLVTGTVCAVTSELQPVQTDPATVLYHLFGFDCIVDTSSRVLLLEVNSYPAIASGTMAGVDVAVYTRLMHDMLTLLVLPLTEGVVSYPAGFVLLPCEQSAGACVTDRMSQQ